MEMEIFSHATDIGVVQVGPVQVVDPVHEATEA